MSSDSMMRINRRPDADIHVGKAEVARMLGGSLSLVSSLIRRGDLSIDCVILEGSQYKPQFLRADVERLGAWRKENPPRVGRPPKSSRKNGGA